MSGFENFTIPEHNAGFEWKEKQLLMDSSKLQLSNLKGWHTILRDFPEPSRSLSFWIKNNPSTESINHDDGMTWAGFIEWRIWDTSCVLDLSIITDKQNTLRSDELELSCKRQVLEFSSWRIWLNISLGWQIWSIWNRGWKKIQNKVHDFRDMPRIENLEYEEEYSRVWINWEIELDYNLVEGYIDVISNGRLEWNDDGSWELLASVLIKGKVHKVTIFLWYQVSIVDWWKNKALSNTLWDGKWASLFAGLNVDLTKNIDFHAKYTDYAKEQNGKQALFILRFKTKS
jgi:hypothetical protein